MENVCSVKILLVLSTQQKISPTKRFVLVENRFIAFLWSRLPRPSHYTIILAVLLLAHQEIKEEWIEQKKKMMMMMTIA